MVKFDVWSVGKRAACLRCKGPSLTLCLSSAESIPRPRTYLWCDGVIDGGYSMG